MRTRSKLLFTALTAALALGALVSIASANRIALSNQTFRVTWDNSTANSLRWSAGGLGEIRCLATIEGSFHSRTLSKVAEALIGYVTRATIGGNGGECTGGSARVLPTTLPWHVRYDSFTAERGLPLIESIKLRLIGATFLLQTSLFACLFQSTAASPMKAIVSRNTTTGQAISLTPEAAQIPLFQTLAGLCPSTFNFSQSSKTMTVQGSTTAITVTLVA